MNTNKIMVSYSKAMRTAWVATAFAAGLALAANADVKGASAKMTIDGRLDEPCWAAADWNGGFVQIAKNKDKGEVKGQTSFAIVADAGNVYIGIRCKEPQLAKVRAMPVDAFWCSDGVELFFAPTGKSFSFYQFAVPLNADAGTAALYRSEGGNIMPDPFGPSWKVERQFAEDEWTLEIAVPLASLYMTRNEEWSGTWLVNLARTRRADGYEWSTWSHLQRAFNEPENFRQVKGFPKRSAADDVALTDVTSEIAVRRSDRLEGRLRMKAFVLEAGDYTLSCSSGTTAKVSLRRGWNDVAVPCAYPANGRYFTDLALTRNATGAKYMRTFPVLVDFDEIRVKLTTPQYRDNFYPGQDSSKIVGTVKTSGEGAVRLTLEGPGIPRTEKTLDAAGAFAFDTPGFEFGTATLTVDIGGVTKRVPIRKLDKTGRRMTWIEDGCIVVDGRRVFRRDLYAWHYRSSTAFKARTAADIENLGLTRLSLGGTLEPGRVIKGLEAKEAKKDVVPCKEYFDKIDAMIERKKAEDFDYWYISDEPECRGVSAIYLRHIYEYMKERDPYHVILTSSRAGLTYIDCADWFETHPYIGPYDDGRGNRRYSRPISEVGNFIDAFEPGKHPDKCVGYLPQLFAYRDQSLDNDYPTLDEYLCSTWAGLLRGAKSLNPFFYTDMGDRAALYDGNCFVNSSVIALEDLLLGGKRTTLLKAPDGECARWNLPDGDAMFVLANFTNERKTFEVKGLDGNFRPFRSKKMFDTSSSPSPSTFTLSPLEVVIGTTKERDRGLSTYEELKESVEKQEYERTHRDNQLLEKYRTLPGIKYKLIDGVRDMYAFGKRWCPAQDFDLAFTDRTIRFSKVRVWGANIKDVKLSVRKRGEWTPVDAVCTHPEQYLFEVDAGKVVESAKLRVTVIAADKNKELEVYELEVPRVPGGDAEHAARKAKPEPPVDALWSFGAKEAVWSEGHSRKAWFGGAKTNVAPRADGGFTVSGQVTHCAVFDPEYPWVEMEVDGFLRNEKPGVKCYHAWSVHGAKMAGLVGGVTYPQPGLYTIMMQTPEKRMNDYLRIYDYNFDIGFRKLRNVKRPPNCLSATAGGEVIAPGSEIEIALELAEPCEDVVAEFRYDAGHGGGAEPYKVNGSSQIELKAADSTLRRWTARVPVKSCRDAKARRVFVKCTVIGGTLGLPILTNFAQPFKSEV